MPSSGKLKNTLVNCTTILHWKAIINETEIYQSKYKTSFITPNPCVVLNCALNKIPFINRVLKSPENSMIFCSFRSAKNTKELFRDRFNYFTKHCTYVCVTYFLGVITTVHTRSVHAMLISLLSSAYILLYQLRVGR